MQVCVRFALAAQQCLFFFFFFLLSFLSYLVLLALLLSCLAARMEAIAQKRQRVPRTHATSV